MRFWGVASIGSTASLRRTHTEVFTASCYLGSNKNFRRKGRLDDAIMLLYPAVDALNEQVPNRYLLVNVVARKAREIADDAENLGEHLSEKPVTLAINGVAAGEVAVDREDLYNALNADERIATSSAPTMADVSEEETEE